jgi:predicted RND superfamily exporter protein
MKVTDLVSRYAQWVIRRRAVVLLTVLTALIALASFAGRIGFDTDYRIWFERDDPYLAQHDRFLKEFGNDDSLVVAFEDKAGILRPAPVQAIQRLTDQLWHVRGVIRVDSLSNFQATRAQPDGVSVENLLPDGATDPATLAKAGAYIDRDPLVVGSLISKSRQVAVIRAKFAPNAINPELPAAVYTQLTALLKAETQRSGYTFHIAGGPITDAAFEQVAKGDMGSLLPLLLGIMVVVLAVVFMSVWAVLVPLLVGLLTIAAVMGFNGLLGLKLDNVTASLPQLLLGISVATVMHVLTTFFEGKRHGLASRQAAIQALEENTVAILLTNLATALGFCSFMVGNIVPVTLLGLMACVGSCILTLLTLTVVPAALSFYPARAPRSPFLMYDLSKLFRRLGQWVIDRPRRVIASWVAVVAVAAACMPMLVVDSNPTGYFAKDHWFRHSIDFMQERGSGGAVYEIVVRGQGPDAIKTAAYMRDLEKLTQYLSKEAPGDFRNVYSLSTIVRNINRSLHDDDDGFHVVPQRDDEVAQYLMLYTLSVPVGQDINDRMNVDASASRITVIRPLVSTKRSREIIDTIEAWAASNLSSAKIEFTGRDVLYTNMGNNLTDSMGRSILWDIAVLLPLLLVMFRTVTAGIVSVFANVGPLIIVMGFMALAHVNLDVGTLMVASLGLGIAVDDTVHLLAHYFRYRKEGAKAGEAALGTLGHMGTAATITTITLALSFLVFMKAEFVPNFYFGVLISMVIGLALLADLTLTPALLSWLDGRRDAKAEARVRQVAAGPAHELAGAQPAEDEHGRHHAPAAVTVSVAGVAAVPAASLPAPLSGALMPAD